MLIPSHCEQEGNAGDVLQDSEAAMVSSGEEEEKEGVDIERQGEREEVREKMGEVDEKVGEKGVQGEMEEEVMKEEEEIREEEKVREKVRGEEEEEEEEERGEEGREEMRVAQGEEDKRKDEEKDSGEDKEGKREDVEEPDIHRYVFEKPARGNGKDSGCKGSHVCVYLAEVANVWHLVVKQEGGKTKKEEGRWEVGR